MSGIIYPTVTLETTQKDASHTVHQFMLVREHSNSEKQRNGASQDIADHVGNWLRHYGSHMSPREMLHAIFK